MGQRARRHAAEPARGGRTRPRGPAVPGHGQTAAGRRPRRLRDHLDTQAPGGRPPSRAPRERLSPSAAVPPHLGAELGVAAGRPDGAYDGGSGVDPGETLAVDPGHATVIMGALALGQDALVAFAPGESPVLWPEHFDVAIRVHDLNFGVSPGDSFIEEPYAYVGVSPRRPGTGSGTLLLVPPCRCAHFRTRQPSPGSSPRAATAPREARPREAGPSEARPREAGPGEARPVKRAP